MRSKTEDIYERHAQNIYRFLFSLTGEADTAEELTQETFYQALKSMDTYRGESSLQVWLCAIAKRLWFKELERRKRSVPIDEAALANIAAPDDPEQSYAERERRLSLYRAIQQLDADTREVIHLRLAGDFSFRDIGIFLDGAKYGPACDFIAGKKRWQN